MTMQFMYAFSLTAIVQVNLLQHSKRKKKNKQKDCAFSKNFLGVLYPKTTKLH